MRVSIPPLYHVPVPVCHTGSETLSAFSSDLLRPVLTVFFESLFLHLSLHHLQLHILHSALHHPLKQCSSPTAPLSTISIFKIRSVCLLWKLQCLTTITHLEG